MDASPWDRPLWGLEAAPAKMKIIVYRTTPACHACWRDCLLGKGRLLTKLGASRANERFFERSPRRQSLCFETVMPSLGSTC